MPSFEYRRLPHFDNTELFSSENECAYFPFHFHDYYCVSLITSGTEVLANTEQEFFAPSGTISITQAGEVHRNRSLSETGYSYKTIYINPDVLEYFSDGVRVEALERVIYNKQLFKDLLRSFHTGALLQDAIKELTRYATRPYEKNRWATSFSRMDEIIESYPNRPIDTDWLCRQFC
ncbi:MAG TPA: AraC family ligand binding domain-containing protein, partial [Puia sp.]